MRAVRPLGLAILLLPFALLAGENGTIQGTISDSESLAPLMGTNVSLEGTTFGASSDREGNFLIENVPPGKYTLVARFVGYATKRVPVELAPGQQLKLSIMLTPTIIQVPAVIVTATSAKNRLTPVTFSDMKLEHIREVYMVQDVPSVLSELPSIVSYSWNGNDIGYSFVNIRGFEQRRISVMVNGVPQNDPEDHNVYWIDMPDLLAYSDNIQVQRGAGSAFYGPPAIGGSINIVTTPVSAEPKVSVSSAFGFQHFGDRGETVLNTRRYGLAIHSGLIEGRYMLFGSLSTIRSSGYREHSWTDLKSYFLGAVRFDEKATTRIHIFGGPLADGLAYTGVPKFYIEDPKRRRKNYSFFSLNEAGDSVAFRSERKLKEIENFFQPHYELLHEWHLSPSVRLHNTIFYVQGDGFFDYDGDWVWFDPAATDWFHTYVGYDTTYGSTNFNSMILRGFVGNKQWGWLPRVEIDHQNGSLTLGGELRIHRSVHWGRIENASIYPPKPKWDPDSRFYEYNGAKDILSVFGHELYRLNESTTLMADLQIVYNRYRIDKEKFLTNSFSVSYLFVNPRVGVNYNVSERLNVYSSVSLTSREPRLRNLYAAEDAWFGAKPQFEGEITDDVPPVEYARYNFDKPLARPERLLDIELGGAYKTQRARITASLFWMEFTDELIKSGQVDIFGAPVTGNAERTRHLGIELVGSWSPLTDVECSGNLTLSRNRLVRFREFEDASRQFVSLDDNPIAGFPDALANARVSYHPGQLSISLLGKHVGAFYTDNRKLEQNKVDAYTVFDVDGSYELPIDLFGVSLTARAKIRNLFNTLYAAGGEGEQFFPAAERSYFVSVTADF